MPPEDFYRADCKWCRKGYSSATHKHLKLVNPEAARLPAATDLFDGETYDAERDEERLAGQLSVVWDIMIDGAWHTLADLAADTGSPEASISARLRDFRKKKWGSHVVNRRYISNGQWEYQLEQNPDGLKPLP